MPDREQVIERLKERISTCSIIGDGFDVTVNWKLADDILALLKEQNSCENCAIAIEDRQLVVRCKNCKHATMTADGKMCKYCEMNTDDFGNQRDVYHDADWFCADGERRQNDD